MFLALAGSLPARRGHGKGHRVKDGDASSNFVHTDQAKLIQAHHASMHLVRDVR